MDALDYNEVSKCKLCPHLGLDHVPSEGAMDADLMLVGNQPNLHEIKAKRPIAGKSGDLLSYMLAELPLGREDVYIANLLKCRPGKDCRGTNEENKTCFNAWLKEEFRLVKPKVTVFLGRDVWTATPAKWKPKHGKVIKTNMAGTIIYWYHPSYYLQRGNVGGFMKLAGIIDRELNK